MSRTRSRRSRWAGLRHAHDVGNGILYLASDASSYVTGATLTIDGGNSIGSLAVHQDKKKPLVGDLPCHRTITVSPL